MQTLVGGMVHTMTEEVQAQVGPWHKYRRRADRNIENAGVAVSEMGERMRSAEARAQESKANLLQQIELLRAMVKQFVVGGHIAAQHAQ